MGVFGEGRLSVVVGTDESYPQFKQVWRPKVPMKIKVFTWLLFKERLLMKVYRVKWAVAATTTCELCSAAPETAAHLFCECVFVRRF
ncbi:hypothetical protein QJS10_CPB14g00427 [Acorus calamus]|uniref:Reverse transcriptase zinc-binding domain-containing protein n=1 Tax=Acorus calamus TaxID=4465 RepID=A0AAV9DCM4_ACOCL|nr:hypothetical protein QJS10_CPB14g00427 [Acorus calamus]